MDERKLAVLCAGLAAALALFVAGYGRTAPALESRSPSAQGSQIRNTPPGPPAPVYQAPRSIVVMAQGGQGGNG